MDYLGYKLEYFAFLFYSHLIHVHTFKDNDSIIFIFFFRVFE